MSSTTPSTPIGEARLRDDAVEVAEAGRHEHEPALRLQHHAGAAGDRIGIAVDRDDAGAAVCGEDALRVAAGPEGAVDEDAATVGCERVEHLRKQHRHVARRRGLDRRRGTRHHRGAPAGAPGARAPAPQDLPQLANLRPCLRQVRRESVRLPDLELVPEPDEGDRVGDAGMALQALGEDRPALRIDLEDLARAVERRREPVALLRIGREAQEESLDLRHQRVAAGVERRRVERRMDVEPLEAVAGEHGPERRRDRHAPLGVEAAREIRHEAVHGPRALPPGTPPPRRTRRHGGAGARTRRCLRSRGRLASPDPPWTGWLGIAWAYMGVNERRRFADLRRRPGKRLFR